LIKEIKNELDVDLKVFKNLFKMINSTTEDRDLAYVTIKNMNMTDIYHMLFLKLLFFTERVSYSAYFNLPYNTETWESLTTHNIVKRINKDESVYKDNYKLIYKKLIYNPLFHPDIYTNDIK
tara:strand:+ start:4819 stop:5184 length:366 start_codon:yes stop_codon:yes gene_type:complete